MRVYLPEYEEGWVEFDPWGADLSHGEAIIDGKRVPISGPTLYAGGIYIDVFVNKSRIPVFVKADHSIKMSDN